MGQFLPIFVGGAVTAVVWAWGKAREKMGKPEGDTLKPKPRKRTKNGKPENYKPDNHPDGHPDDHPHDFQV